MESGWTTVEKKYKLPVNKSSPSQPFVDYTSKYDQGHTKSQSCGDYTSKYDQGIHNKSQSCGDYTSFRGGNNSSIPYKPRYNNNTAGRGEQGGQTSHAGNRGGQTSYAGNRGGNLRGGQTSYAGNRGGKPPNKKLQRNMPIPDFENNDEKVKFEMLQKDIPHLMMPGVIRRIQQQENIAGLATKILSEEWIKLQRDGWKYVRVIKPDDPNSEIPEDGNEYDIHDLDNGWSDLVLFQKIV